MTMLVGELVELARGEELDVAPSEFRLDEVVQAAVDRAARRAPGLSFRTRLEPSRRHRRARACRAGGLEPARQRAQVEPARRDRRRRGSRRARRGPRPRPRDRGRGRPARLQSLLPLARARGMPGAGLGLAIVKQIADAHGGSVTIDRAPDGGAILRLRLSADSLTPPAADCRQPPSRPPGGRVASPGTERLAAPTT